MPLIQKKIKSGVMVLDDLDHEYVNKKIWPMIDDMRHILIKLISKPILQSRLHCANVFDRALTGIDFRDSISVALLLKSLYYTYCDEINIMWHAYGKRRDRIIVSSLDKILSYKSIKGLECLVHFIHTIGVKAFEFVDFTLVIKVAFEAGRKKFRAHVHKNVAEAVNVMIDNLKKSRTLIKCPAYNICSGYDNRDFYLNEFNERI